MMGFFSKIGGTLKKAATTYFTKTPVGKVQAKVLDTVTAAFTDPVTFVTKGPKAAIEKSTSRTGLQNLPRTLTTTAVAAGAVLGAGTTAGRAVATKVAKAVIPKTTKGKLIAAAVVPVVATTVAKKPSTLISAPKKVVKAQVGVGGLIAEPSVSKAKEFVQENPLVTGLAAAGLAVVGAKTLAPAAGGLLTSRAVAKAAEKPIVIEGIPTAPVAPQQQLVTAAPIGIEGQAPITPETVTVSPTKTPRKRRRATKKTIMRQSVRVNVVSNSGNKRYIKQGIFN